MKNLIIIGAGGFGREVLMFAMDILKVSPNSEWEIGGFIDDTSDALNGKQNFGYEVIGSISEHVVESNNVYICALGDIETKKMICDNFLNKGANFINIIHPTALVTPGIQIGFGNIFCPNVGIAPDVTIGNFVTINSHSGCGHDSKIGNYCTISSYCDVTGGVILNDQVFLGSHVSIYPGVHIGYKSRVGMGSIVIKNVDSEVSVFGNPAKII